jgi:hypothetical protein
MKIPSSVLHVPGHGFATAILLVALTVSAQTQEPKAKSLLPVFGSEGKEFNTKGQNGNLVKGWLPNNWTDNSEWASVSATYTKLADPPEKEGAAVRIKVEKIEDGQLQLTTYQGTQNFKKGAKYVVSGWVRSPDQIAITAGIRQNGEQTAFYQVEEQ